MPFYEYECSACKFYVEALQKISDAPLKKCPSCKKQTLKRLVSAPVFRLKGGGWYETDFKSDQETKRNLVESGDRDATAESSKGASDGKPETKTDGKAEAQSATNKSAAKADKAAASPRRTGPSKARAAAARSAKPKTVKTAKKKK